VFTPEERGAIRDALVAAARADGRLSGVALFGSAAEDREDEWSDIDLAFGVEGDLDAVVADWTARMYDEHAAIDHLDMRSGETLYRVFLTKRTLQVDLAFAPPGPPAEPFKLPPPPAGPDPVDLVRTAWLYALHARSALARGRLWQAEQMIAGVRHAVLALACARYGLPAAHGKGADDLPRVVLAFIEPAVPASVSESDLRRAHVAAVMALRQEVGFGDRERAIRLLDPIVTLAR
jgi:hypothetical protein